MAELEVKALMNDGVYVRCFKGQSKYVTDVPDGYAVARASVGGFKAAAQNGSWENAGKAVRIQASPQVARGTCHNVFLFQAGAADPCLSLVLNLP